MSEINERVARLEAKQETTIELLREIKGDLKSARGEQDKRLDTLEETQASHSTHFRWIYGVFGTFKASIVAWLVHKG